MCTRRHELGLRVRVRADLFEHLGRVLRRQHRRLELRQPRRVGVEQLDQLVVDAGLAEQLELEAVVHSSHPGLT